jgi:flavin-dependent dehydrogenase
MTVAARLLRAIIPTKDDPLPWQAAIDHPTDALAGASPLGIRATLRAGPGWFLVGDAAGFLDPLSGEGLHRALVSAEIAAAAIVATIRGPASAADAAAAYDRAMRRRFATKDVVSWLLQAFLARPSGLEYAARRLAARPDARATMGLVMGDLIPARHGLDPRFLAAVLAP